MIKFIPKNNITKNGFAVLFAVLLASFLITLGISIFSISLKEIQLATSARDSQIAYYVADSARECALYSDVKLGKFPTCIDSTCSKIPDINDINGDLISAQPSFSVKVTCNGVDSTLTFIRNPATTTSYISNKVINFFQASSTSSSTPVSDIRITKQYITTTNGVQTTIETWGHNTGIFGRRVERGFSQVLK